MQRLLTPCIVSMKAQFLDPAQWARYWFFSVFHAETLAHIDTRWKWSCIQTAEWVTVLGLALQRTHKWNSLVYFSLCSLYTKCFVSNQSADCCETLLIEGNITWIISLIILIWFGLVIYRHKGLVEGGLLRWGKLDSFEMLVLIII